MVTLVVHALQAIDSEVSTWRSCHVPKSDARGCYEPPAPGICSSLCVVSEHGASMWGACDGSRHLQHAVGVNM
jgi:hypothetical protein